MSQEYSKLLSKALRDLKVFSVPRLGTFERESFPAHIDPATNTIKPPRETVKFVQGRMRFKEDLVKYLGQQLGQTAAEADQTAEAIGVWAVEEVKKGSLKLDGGTLHLRADAKLEFEPASEDPILAGFGLPEVEMASKEDEPVVPKTGSAGKGKLADKAEARKAADPKEDRKVRMKALDEQIAAPAEEEPVKRKNPFFKILIGIIIGCILLIVGFVVYREIRTHKASQPAPVPAPAPAAPAPAPAPEPEPAPAPAPKPKPAAKPAAKPKPRPAPQPQENTGGEAPAEPHAAAAAPAASGGGVVKRVPRITVPASAGTRYHIIIQGMLQEEHAWEEYKKWKAKGFAPTFVKGKGVAIFRVSLYSSGSKEDCLKKLETWRKAGKLGADEGWVLNPGH